MTRKELIEVIRRVLNMTTETDDEGDGKEHEVLPGSSLKEDLLMTSFSFMLLSAELEEKLGRELDPELFRDTETVEDLYQRISSLQSDKDAGRIR